jgi:hypothetical protein
VTLDRQHFEAIARAGDPRIEAPWPMKVEVLTLTRIHLPLLRQRGDVLLAGEVTSVGFLDR